MKLYLDNKSLHTLYNNSYSWLKDISQMLAALLLNSIKSNRLATNIGKPLKI